MIFVSANHPLHSPFSMKKKNFCRSNTKKWFIFFFRLFEKFVSLSLLESLRCPCFFFTARGSAFSENVSCKITIFWTLTFKFHICCVIFSHNRILRKLFIQLVIDTFCDSKGFYVSRTAYLSKLSGVFSCLGHQRLVDFI